MHLNSCSRNTTLLDGMANTKRQRDIEYLLSLRIDNLLLPFRFEAGLVSINYKKTDIHWGWDSPLSQIRGTFTGHWLSAAARIIANTGNGLLQAMSDIIVDEIKVCQIDNGGQWAFPIPEKYLQWLKNGKKIWAPQYVCHKVMMGLLDIYQYTGNEKALDIVNGCAEWFYDFTAEISREQMDDMMDLEETGGIMEFWADLYGITANPRHKELMFRYERPRLFQRILDNEDVLTNIHANITIPEIQGAARAYEITEDERYRQIVENYWSIAVEKRGSFVTGGQTSGEIWTPINKQAARLGDKNQEHCVVYNMMKLSQYLFKWTGDKKYADYWEQNLYNGIYAQGFWEEKADHFTNETRPVQKGLVSYFLPLEAGGQKKWGSATEHFWCCHCTLVQANASFHESIYYWHDNQIYVAQYIPSKLDIQVEGKQFIVEQTEDRKTASIIKINDIDIKTEDRPSGFSYKISIKANGQKCAIKFRIPWWLAGKAVVYLDDELLDYIIVDDYIVIDQNWYTSEIRMDFPARIFSWALPDQPDTAAFIYGPVAYAIICDKQISLYGNIDDPQSFIIADNEREWTRWLPYFRTINQPVNYRLVPINEIGYEKYTTYFQIVSKYEV